MHSVVETAVTHSSLVFIFSHLVFPNRKQIRFYLQETLCCQGLEGPAILASTVFTLVYFWAPVPFTSHPMLPPLPVVPVGTDRIDVLRLVVWEESNIIYITLLPWDPSVVAQTHPDTRESEKIDCGMLFLDIHCWSHGYYFPVCLLKKKRQHFKVFRSPRGTSGDIPPTWKAEELKGDSLFFPNTWE